eukprot:GHVU01124716.1.p1 GENE.GHVU01124716.1~~GHVU01124716.1.p1  ORF type:complete len:447 (+),score=55.85 GHVU01124716.1:500-1840(+)
MVDAAVEAAFGEAKVCPRTAVQSSDSRSSSKGTGTGANPTGGSPTANVGAGAGTAGAAAAVVVPVERTEEGEDTETVTRRKEKWRRLLRLYARRFGRCSAGNEVHLFAGESGDDCFADMLAAIGRATERVWLETYILDDSNRARHTCEALRAAARRGVQVVLLLDWIGSYNAPSNCLRQMQADGVHVVHFNPVLPVGSGIGPIAFRDHRKLLIIDSQCAYVGSMNVSRDTEGGSPGEPSRFYDIHARVRGPAVADLGDVFVSSLRESGAEREVELASRVAEDLKLRSSAPLGLGSLPAGGCYVQVLDSNVRRRVKSIQRVMESVVSEADSSVHLTTSYFLPPGFLRRALLRCQRNRVPVSVLLSGNSDIPGDVAASKYVVGKLLGEASGRPASVYLMRNRHCHAKTISIDGVWASVGSFNWDRYVSGRGGVVQAATARSVAMYVCT